MKKIFVLIVFLSVVLTACAGSPANPSNQGEAPTAVSFEQPMTVVTPIICSKPTAPKGGQIFEASVGGHCYDVVYDPLQGGSADHPALGWWHQTQLPAGPSRMTHNVAVTLQAPAKYRFTGPECRVWLNTDGNKPWEQGKLIIDRQNMLSIDIPQTIGHKGEAWIAVKCLTSWASGFSFEKLP